MNRDVNNERIRFENMEGKWSNWFQVGKDDKLIEQYLKNNVDILAVHTDVLMSKEEAIKFLKEFHK